MGKDICILRSSVGNLPLFLFFFLIEVAVNIFLPPLNVWDIPALFLDCHSVLPKCLGVELFHKRKQDRKPRLSPGSAAGCPFQPPHAGWEYSFQSAGRHLLHYFYECLHSPEAPGHGGPCLVLTPEIS